MKSHPTSAKKPSAEPGFFAALRALFGADGSGAHTRRAFAALAALLCATAATLAFIAAPASAAISHPFRTTLDPSATPTGSFSQFVCDVDVDAATQKVYVSDSGNGNVDIFNSAGSYQSTVTGAGTAGDFRGQACSTAVNDSDGRLYVADDRGSFDIFDGTGAYLGQLSDLIGGISGGISVAADNSGGPSSGAIYVSDSGIPAAGGISLSLRKFDADGNPANFSASAAYISANEVTGTPSGDFRSRGEGLGRVVVDPHGNIYVGEAHQIDEFAPSGSFIRSFTGAGAPGGFSGGRFALDPISENLLVVDPSGTAVDEFSPAGAYIGQTTGTFAGPFTSIRGISVNSAGDLYVAQEVGENVPGEVDVFGPAHPLPVATTGEASQIADTAATLNGAVNPEETAASYRFEYGTTKAYGHKAPPSAAPVGNDNTSHPESAEIEALQPSTTYHFRIDAITECEAGQECTSYGADQTFHTHGPPLIDATPTSTIFGATAQIEAPVNPSGHDTTVKVLYGETEAYGSETAPLDIGAANEDQAASIALPGLLANTTYHYRLLATNHCNPAAPAEECSVQSSDASFETGDALSIDFTSASEITTTAATLSAQIDPLDLPTTYHFEYLPEAQFKANGETFSGATVLSDASVPGHPLGTATGTLTAGSRNIHSLNISSGSFPIGAAVTAVGIPSGTILREPIHNGTTPVLSNPATGSAVAASLTVPASVSQPLTGLLPETPYVYRVLATNSAAAGEIAGPPQLLITHPSGLDAALPDDRAYELVSPGVKTGGGGVLGSFAQDGFLATADGSAITYPGEGFFEPPNGNFPQSYTSFRGPAGWSTRNTSGEDLEESFAPLAPPTLPPAPVLPPAAGPGARVLEQTPDGSVVFFTDTADLTPGANAAPGEPDLYRYDVAAEEITDLSVDSNPGQHADVQGVLGAGDEGAEAGSYVYFVANGVLASGASPGNCSPENNPEGGGTTPGTACNLYLSHDGATTFVTTLSAEDDLVAEGQGGQTGLEPRDWAQESGSRTAEASPGGRYLIFLAFEQLTPQLAPFTGPEIFRYDAVAKALVCASCETDGSASPGAFLSYLGQSDRHPHAIADDGRLFFNDAGALSPRDLNAKTDVYEFEDAGTGTCQTSGGCRSLISGGGGTGKSYFAGAGAEGNDVFFTSNQRLSSEDRDESLDVYDARIDGREPPAEPEICESTGACHGPVPPPPAEQTAGTATFHSSGNPVEKSCKKGFVKKGTKCVKKPSKKHHKHHGKRAGRNGGGGK